MNYIQYIVYNKIFGNRYCMWIVKTRLINWEVRYGKKINESLIAKVVYDVYDSMHRIFNRYLYQKGYRGTQFPCT